MKKLGFQPNELVAFFKSSIIPVLEYASPVWGHALTTQQIADLENIQCRALKIIFGRRVKILSAEYIELLDKYGLQLLVKRRENQLFKFGLSLLDNPKYRNWLPDFNFNNSRLRKKNFIVPFKCNRVRYQNSTLPAIVELFNSKFRENERPFSKYIAAMNDEND